MDDNKDFLDKEYNDTEEEIHLSALFEKSNSEPQPSEQETTVDEDEVLNNIFEQKKAAAAQTGKVNVKKVPVKKAVTRQTLSEGEIETLAQSTEEAVADGRYGAALDSVFFVSGSAREALRDKINVRIPIGSEEEDLPVISSAALIESYLENGDIVPKDIIEKLHVIIESSKNQYNMSPTDNEVKFRVYECAIIMCVQAEQCGRHSEIKTKLYGAENSFLAKFLEVNTNNILATNRKELIRFSESVKFQSRAVYPMLEDSILFSENAEPLLKRFFAKSKPILAASIVSAVLCLAAVIIYLLSSGSIMSFVATDKLLMLLLIVIEILFTAGMVGVTILITASGTPKE